MVKVMNERMHGHAQCGAGRRLARCLPGLPWILCCQDGPRQLGQLRVRKTATPVLALTLSNCVTRYCCSSAAHSVPQRHCEDAVTDGLLNTYVKTLGNMQGKGSVLGKCRWGCNCGAGRMAWSSN